MLKPWFFKKTNNQRYLNFKSKTHNNKIPPQKKDGSLFIDIPSWNEFQQDEFL